MHDYKSRGHFTKASKAQFSNPGQKTDSYVKSLYKGFHYYFLTPIKKLIVVLNHYIKASKPTIYQCHYYVYVIKLLKNTEKKCTNNASHEVKKFCLLKRPTGAHDAHGPWALRVGPVHGPLHRAHFPLI
jgi:hypothetical protein